MLIAGLAPLSACTTPGTQREAESAPAVADPEPTVERPARVAEVEREPPASPATTAPSAEMVKPGTGTFINDSAAAEPLQAPDPDGEMSFNFQGESLLAVIETILGQTLKQNYVVAPGVQGTVTFSTARPLRAEQAMPILEMLLRWNNATLIWQDGRYTVLPIAQAVPGNISPRTGPAALARGFEARAIPLRYISANAMTEALKPYAKPEAFLSTDVARNMLVLSGTRAELENYQQTIDIFDVDWLAGMSVGVFTLTQAEAAKVVVELEKIFGESGKTPVAGMFRFMPLEGVNGIMVITPQPKYLETIREWIERFDIGGGEAGQRLYVYDIKNVKADDLASTLSDIFGSGGQQRSAPTNTGVVAPGLESVLIRSLGADGRPALPQQGGDDGTKSNPYGGNVGAGGLDTGSGRGGGISMGASDEVRISAVEESNALIVRATPGQWESIRRVIERLDQIPLQVHVEAQILQVQLNDQLEYGIQSFFENAVGSSAATMAGLPASALMQSRGREIWGDLAGRVTSGGTSWSFVGPDAAAVIDALDSVSHVQVLSRPSVVVLNNKEASINVGTQIPVVSAVIGQIGTGVGAGDPLSSSYTQFRDTGITLSVTPRVNPGGLVFMEIDQTDSVPGAASTAVGGNVAVNQRKINTEVAVQSGQTLILGGLITQSDTSGSGGLPGLHRLPFIGALFGKKNRNSSRQELLVLITPKVIRSTEDAARVTNEYREGFRNLKPMH